MKDRPRGGHAVGVVRGWMVLATMSMTSVSACSALNPSFDSGDETTGSDGGSTQSGIAPTSTTPTDGTSDMGVVATETGHTSTTMSGTDARATDSGTTQGHLDATAADSGSVSDSDTHAVVFDLGPGSSDGAVYSACCEGTQVPGCGDPVIEQCTCFDGPAPDLYCCGTDWDDICVNAAIANCELECPDPRNPTDCCSVEANPGCDDPVVEDCVCNIDDQCCSGAWDIQCVNLADTECDAMCTAAPPETSG